MRVVPVGTKVLDFVTKEGTRIVGTNLYVTYPEEGVEGLKVEKFFINSSISLPSNFAIGSAVDVFFNMRGKVEAIIVPQSTTAQPTTPARPATAATAATTPSPAARPANATAATAATTATAARPRIDKEVE